MIGIVLITTVLIGLVLSRASSALDDNPAPKQDGITVIDGLIFSLCLLGVLAAKRRKENEDD